MQHQEWLQLLEISGPFLAMPVIAKTFPQGLERLDTTTKKELRLAYQEWLASHSNDEDSRKYHVPWIRYVLKNLLEFPGDLILEGESIPSELTIQLPEHGEALKPDLVIMPPGAQPSIGPRILVSVLPPQQKLDRALTERTSRWNASPATRMMELLKRLGVRVGVVTNGEHWLLVYSPESDTTSFVGWYASVWMEEELTIRSFRGLLSAYRFFGVPEAETLESLLAASTEFQHEVTTQLGGQVRRAIEQLVQALDQIDKDSGRSLLHDVSEAKLYEAGVSVMMRLVFLLTAEERELFPINNPVYSDNYAVLTLREQLERLASRHGEEVLERRYDAWNRLLATFRAIYAGVRHEDFNLPAYGGNLFDPDRYPFLEGRAPETLWHETNVVPLSVNDRTVLHLLDSLQLLRGTGNKSEARKLSFRALDVEQIGHVYESLLEHTAVRAGDLVLGLEGAQGKEPEVPISRLQYQKQQGENGLLDWLHDETGKSTSALTKLLLKHDRYPDYKVRAVCDNQDSFYSSVKPFIGLVREDSQSMPVIFTPGSVYVTESDERRSTGTHYTPRSLTEPVIQHALDPLVYAGLADGVAASIDTLRPPQAILDLKICDMSCGSGAFLVQTCRYLSERLLEAWTKCRANAGDATEIDIYGRAVTTETAVIPKHVVPKDPNDALFMARRLIADRCLYGVDCNPMAVEMAKLSLWLATLQRETPFTFLDHAIKCGDSLIGVRTINQLENFDLSVETKTNTNILSAQLSTLLESACEKRLKLEEMVASDICDTDVKERLHNEAEQELAVGRHVANVLVGITLAQTGRSDHLRSALELASVRLAAALAQSIKSPSDLSALEKQLLPGPFRSVLDFCSRWPFHWPLEFPEVFLRELPGFDAIVGNPPFLGGSKISGSLGASYREYLVNITVAEQRGNGDLCAYFFRQADTLLRQQGTFGLLATNTISEGETRELSLSPLVKQGTTIYKAVKTRKWPGAANLEVAHIWARKGNWNNTCYLDTISTTSIPPTLTIDHGFKSSPSKLAANSRISFEGSKLTGIGFVLNQPSAQSLLQAAPHYERILLPFLNGTDLTTSANQSATRIAINFYDWPLERNTTAGWQTADDAQKREWLQSGVVPADYAEPVATDFPECLDIVRSLVKPERDKNNRDVYRQKWWQYAEKRPGLYQAISQLSRVMVIPRVSKYLSVSWQSTRQVLSDSLTVVASEDDGLFAVLQSTLHEIWARHCGSTLRVDPRYTPSDCFETFPFPDSVVVLRNVGAEYAAVRSRLCTKFGEGLTKIYNRFHSETEHDSEIQCLRELHIKMDCAVKDAYGWSDLDLDHSFRAMPQGPRFTLSDRVKHEILARFFKLNDERHRQELQVALINGNGKKMTGKGKGRKKK